MRSIVSRMLAVCCCGSAAATLGCNERGASSAPFGEAGSGGASGGSEASSMGGRSGAGAAGGGSGGGGGNGAAATGGTSSNPEPPDTGAGGTGSTPAGVPYVFTGSTNGMLRAFSMNASDGSLTPAGSIQTPDGLDYVALGPDDRTFFVSRDSGIAAYVYDRAAQSFSAGDDAATAGGGTFVAVDPAGQRVLVAHYSEGQLSLLPYSAGSGFGALTALTPGENAHQVRLDSSGRHVYVPCLGSDHIALYDLDPALGTLSPAQPPTVAALGGPRHMDFHPLAPIAYVLTENSSELHVYDINGTSGALSLRPGDSVYTSEDEEYHWSSDVHVTPDGRFLYATNREPPEIVIFSIAADASLERVTAEPLDGVARAFAIDPAGRYLQIGDEDGQLLTLRIDASTGALSRTASTPNLGDVHTTIVRYLE
jgi:6-phosphogluconolactonase